MIEGIELREIRTFLAVADELHFGRAAERVGLTSSRVSQSIRSLESRIGGALFDRTSRRVALTPLGRQLRDHLQPAHDALAAALTAARETARGVAGTIHLGMFNPPIYAGPHITRIVRTFETRYPNCTVLLRDVPFEAQLDWLRSGAGDALVIRLPNSASDLTIGPTMTDEKRVLAIAADHPLAGRGQADAEDLGDLMMIDIATVPRELMNAFLPPLTPSGRPIPRLEVHRLTEILPLIALGAAAHATVRSFAEHYRYPSVAYIPVTGLPRSRTALAWLTRRTTARIIALAQTAENVLAAVRKRD
ncbi:LysR family transcriptional regulator [Nonomuraea angiospora]|uniref:DNA-binding transcriptional LysR family regulator n=1 Tax=Nonomuraea angiospora TaxID=46172 RepID=A0ABR9M9Z1_9ACTN|nr:LysR family transcriptional regulator [Nonomuraea angiospora]MBE1589317.1 DNA-binding transcriptional LysR family regulator [Nonomuraea angiospora]